MEGRFAAADLPPPIAAADLTTYKSFRRVSTFSALSRAPSIQAWPVADIDSPTTYRFLSGFMATLDAS
jgi:hypothetical protein